MEIPYVVTPRKDTGLFNSKIAIWLFLASEVMLFGGFFSAYVFLRIGADYPWPERTLPVLPGLINTFVLIGSSVTVVFAWASLKMRQWRQFQLFMGITVACAGIFMVLKGIEYNVKFHHQAVRLKDYTVVEGHLGTRNEGDMASNMATRSRRNQILDRDHPVSPSAPCVSTRTMGEGILSQAGAPEVQDRSRCRPQGRHQGVAVPSRNHRQGRRGSRSICSTGSARSISTPAPTTAALRTAALRSEWKAKAENPGKRGWEFASECQHRCPLSQPRMLTEIAAWPSRWSRPPVSISNRATSARVMHSRACGMTPWSTANCSTARWSSTAWTRSTSSHLAMKAVGKGRIPIAGRELLACQEPRLRPRGMGVEQGAGRQTGEATHRGLRRQRKPASRSASPPPRSATASAGRTSSPRPTAWIAAGRKSRSRRSSWDRITRGARPRKPSPNFRGPARAGSFASKFTPAWNTYYAIYFTITGLHGLHVIGGALVLGLLPLLRPQMYETNPEWLANRVEVGGLFWHFVDLVWIFVFPILLLDVTSFRPNSPIPNPWPILPKQSANPSAPTCSSVAVLFIGTIVTVLVATVPRSMSATRLRHLGRVLGLAIAAVKASLVAAIFMHLNHEKKAVYWIFGFGIVCVIALFGLTALAKSDPIRDPLFYGISKTPAPLASPSPIALIFKPIHRHVTQEDFTSFSSPSARRCSRS
jgi:heme/copper-type cytochrome/quinol oxidase subunit 3/cytochrome c oxidase subunit IV